MKLRYFFLVIVLLLAGVFRTGTVAYALEQTIEANRGVRTIHWEVTLPDDWVTELWIEVNSDGIPLRLRSYSLDRHDGPKEFVWEDGKITGTPWTIWSRVKTIRWKRTMDSSLCAMRRK